MSTVGQVHDPDDEDVDDSAYHDSAHMTGPQLTESQQEAINRMVRIVDQFILRNDSGPFREPVDWRGLELYDYPEIVKRMMDLGTIKRKLDRNQYSSAAEVAYDIRQVWKNCMTYNAENSEFYRLAKAFSKRFEDRYRRIRNDFDIGVEPKIEEEDEAKSERTDKRKRHEVDDDDDEEEGDENEEEEDEADTRTNTRRGGRSSSSAVGRRVTKRQRSRSRDVDSEEFVDNDGEDEAGENDDDVDVYDEDEIDDDERSPSSRSRGRGRSCQNPKLDVKAKFAANLLLLSGLELGFIVTKLERSCPQALEQGPKMAVPEQLEIIIDAIDPETFSSLSSYAADKVAQRKRTRQLAALANHNNNSASPTATQTSGGIPNSSTSSAVGASVVYINSNNSDEHPSPDVAPVSSGSSIKKKRKR